MQPIEEELDFELEPIGTIPKVGDHVVCFGQSVWRQIGVPYKVISETEFDVMTGEDEAWEKKRFEHKEVLSQNYPAGFTDQPRVYRVVKRGSLDQPVKKVLKVDWLKSLKEGDEVTRMLAGQVPMKLKVTAIEDKVIICGDWKFHIDTGGEIDEDLGWDGLTVTGSYLTNE